MSQLMNMGTVVGYVPNSSSFVIVDDGYYQVHAYVTPGSAVQIGRVYTVHKNGNTYFLGAEVRA
jgi:hypothetical protein